MPKIAELEIQISNRASEASKSINSLKNSMRKYNEEAPKFNASLKETAKNVDYSPIYNLAKNLEFLEKKVSGFASKMRGISSGMKALSTASDLGSNSFKNFYQYVNSLDRIITPLASKLQSVADGMNAIGYVAPKTAPSTATSGKASQINTAETATLAGGMAEISDKASEASKNLNSVSNTTEKVNKSFKSTSKSAGLFSGKIGGLVKQFGKMLKLKIMRTIIANIIKGFSESIGYLYQYSKAMDNTDATSFKDSMDRISTSLQYLKNSLAAVTSPIVEALTPAIEKLVDWLVRGIDVVNQFFSALNGNSTYTRAKKYVKEYAESTSDSVDSAKESIEELKATILGFDEINALNAPSGTSGSGSVASADNTPNYLEMFEEASIDPKVIEYMEEIRSAVQKVWGAFSNLIDAFDDFWNSPAIVALRDALFKSAINSIEASLLLVADVLGLITAILNGDVIGTIRRIGDIFFDLNLLSIDLAYGIFSAVTGILKGLANWLIDLAFGLVSDLQGIIRDFMLFWADRIEWINPKWSEMTRQMAEDFSGGLDIAEQKAHDWVNGTTDTVEELYGKYRGRIEDVRTSWDSAWDFAKEDADASLGDIVNKGAETYNSLQGNISATKSDIASVGSSWQEVSNNMSRTIPSIQIDTSTADWQMSNFKWQWENSAPIELKAQVAFDLSGEAMLNEKLAIRRMATGGVPTMGTMFIAGENGAGTEMVGTINGKTGVVSQGEISGIRASVESSGNKQAQLLARTNAILEEIASKSGNGQITVGSIIDGMNKYNRVAGRVTV